MGVRSDHTLVRSSPALRIWDPIKPLGVAQAKLLKVSFGGIIIALCPPSFQYFLSPWTSKKSVITELLEEETFWGPLSYTAHPGSHLHLDGQFWANLSGGPVGLRPMGPQQYPTHQSPSLRFSPFLVLPHYLTSSWNHFLNNLLVPKSLSQSLHWGCNMFYMERGQNTDFVVTKPWIGNPVWWPWER